MKNQIDFVKIKFHPNENIKWNCMQFELISNSTIGLRFNWIEKNEMKIGGKSIDNLLVKMVLEKKCDFITQLNEFEFWIFIGFFDDNIQN
jgi:hypothetical protein